MVMLCKSTKTHAHGADRGHFLFQVLIDLVESKWVRTACCPWLSWCSRIQSCTRCCPRSRTQPSAFLCMHVERADIFVSHLSTTSIVGWPETFMKVYVKGSRPILDAPRIVCTPSQTCLHVINLLRLSQIRVHIWLYVIKSSENYIKKYIIYIYKTHTHYN